VIVEHEDFGELALRPHRVYLKLAEASAQRDMLLGREMLVAQHDDLVLDEGGFESLKS
jgi:hypothetical protein